MKKLILLLSLASVVVAAHAEVSGQPEKPSFADATPPGITYYGQPLAARDAAVAAACEMLAVDDGAIGVIRVRVFHDATTTVDLSVPALPQQASDGHPSRRDVRFVLRKASGNQYGWLISEVRPATD